MNTWVSRIKLRMQELDMTQEVLANKMGITRGAITHYLASRRIPPLKQFQKLANILKVEAAWLQFGVTNVNVAHVKKSVNKIERVKEVHQPIPVLSWEQVAEFVDVSKLDKKEIKEVIPHFFTDQQRWYGLRIKGDSMTSTLGGHHVNFVQDDFIIVDPDKAATHGSYVIALQPKAKEVTFKQYVIDGGKRYLKPINPQYPIIAIDNKTHIIGVVVGCWRNMTFF